MKAVLQILVSALICAGAAGQELRYQAGHTHHILKVRFSPDDSKLVSYSWGDGWLCYWDIGTGQLLWKSRTDFIQKAEEQANLEQFGWNKDESLIYSRSDNGTFQIWDAATGRILSVSESSPAPEAFTGSATKASVTKGFGREFHLINSETNERSTIRAFSGTGSTYDVSHDGRLFAEGGDWGHAVIRISRIGDPKGSYDLKGGRIKSHVPTELEARLLEEKGRRQAVLNEARERRDKRAAVETEDLKKQVHITFDHYGDMKDPGELRLVESDAPDQSKLRKSRRDASAIWLCLHNDSSLPIRIPTLSMYIPNPKCFFDFSAGNRILGICDNREISVWFGLENKKGKPIPYGFDFGSSAILLPRTSVLFPVPRPVLSNGNAIVFDFTFQAETDAVKNGDYGTAKTLRFREADLAQLGGGYR